jgi:quercetin dioxygenase-like cupin family protein
VSSRSALLVVVALGALTVGGIIGFASGRGSSGDSAGAEPAGVIAEGELAGLADGALAVRAERVVLPAGFRSRHVHGGPTFNFVDAGAVVIESEGRERRHDGGGFFFEPAGRVHTITVLDDARLRVIRLLPPGVEATTEVP